MAEKLTTELFIYKAQAKHGLSKYDYSKTVYGARNTDKVIITCKFHGEFLQAPNKHMAGCGCPICGRTIVNASRVDNLNRFIQKARMVHGLETYDYSKTIYLPNPKKIAIICPVHGEFQQTAGEHISGRGCKKCATTASGLLRRRRKTTEVAKFRELHSIAYDYSKLPDVFTSKELLIIICPTHGEFQQPHYVHIIGKGCSLCAGTARGLERRRTTEEFIAEAREVHGNKYDYSQSIYVLGQQPVAIICPAHGTFWQQPASHINAGCGCPTCAKEAKRQGWVSRAKGRAAVLYFLRFFDSREEFYKVGITFYSVAQRYTSKRDLAGYQYEVLAKYTSTNAAAVHDWEQSIIETFAHLAYRPSRPFNGTTECFSSADEILAIFPL